MIVTANQRAFLNMIAWSEGTDDGRHATKFHGYDVVVGGSLITCFDHHPRKLVQLSPTLRSTAAGRYQFIWPTWKALVGLLNLPDFSPHSQDLACLELLRECGALPFIGNGQFAQAVEKARKIWASLPGAGYGQRENKLASLQAVYQRSGGTVA